MNIDQDLNEMKRSKSRQFKSKKSEMKKAKSSNTFDKYSTRKDIFVIKKTNKFAPIYYPNFNYCKRRLNKLCIPFHKVAGRLKKNQSPAIQPPLAFSTLMYKKKLKKPPK